jgi:peptidoglycan/xylan/chitin deacetylase (PgdA/CDA1 family)
MSEMRLRCVIACWFGMLTGCAAALGQAAAQPVAASAGIPILTYHRFDPVKAASTTVTTAAFEGQMDYLAAHGYKIARLGEVTDELTGRRPMEKGPVTAITVDDGHESVYTVLWPIVQRRKIPVTLFIYPSAISNSKTALTWEQLKTMQASGLVEVQSHTYWHPDFRKEKKKQTPAAYAAFVDMQLVKSKAKLDAELGLHVDLLAWPYGIVDPELEAAAKRAGYRAAFGYEGYVARPGEDAWAIHRIPVPDFARGAGFGALLGGTRKPVHGE